MWLSISTYVQPYLAWVFTSVTDVILHAFGNISTQCVFTVIYRVYTSQGIGLLTLQMIVACFLELLQSPQSGDGSDK